MHENFLSHFTRALLCILFLAITLAIVALPFFLDEMLAFFGDMFFGAPGYGGFILPFLLVCGAGALWILAELILVMKTLKSDPFVMRNASAFSRMALAAEILAVLFGVKTAFFFTPMTCACCLVLLLCGLFAAVLSGVFRRAVEFKQENDLTI